MERQALLSWGIVALHGLDVNIFLKIAGNEEFACII